MEELIALGALRAPTIVVEPDELDGVGLLLRDEAHPLRAGLRGRLVALIRRGTRYREQDAHKAAARPVHVGVLLADVAGNRGHLNGGAGRQMSVPVTVRALADLDFRGRLFRINLRQLHDVVGGNFANRARVFGRVILHGINDRLERGGNLDVGAIDFHGIGARNCCSFGHLAFLGNVAGNGDGGIDGLQRIVECGDFNGLVRLFVPYEVFAIAHNELLSRFVNQERSVGGGADVVLVDFVVIDDPLHHAEHERGVGAGTNGNPPVGLGGCARAARVDDDDLCARFLGVEDEVHFLLVGFSVVAAEHDDRLRAEHVFPVGGILLNAHGRDPAHVAAEVAHDAEVRPLGTVVGVRHHGREALRHDAVVANHGDPGVGRGAVFLDIGGHFLVDEVDGLFPADALPFAGAALGALDALHGVLHPVGRVDALHGIGDAAQANAVVAGVGEIGRLNLDDGVVFDERVDAAAADAVRCACATADFVVFGLCGANGVFGFLGIVFARRRASGEHLRNCCGSGN